MILQGKRDQTSNSRGGDQKAEERRTAKETRGGETERRGEEEARTRTATAEKSSRTDH